MATRTVKRRTGVGAVQGTFLQFLTLAAEAKTITKRATTLKGDLMSFAEDHGEEDEKGHRLHTLAAPVEVGGQKFLGFQRQRRVSAIFDEEAASTLCEEKGFERSDYISVQEYVDQDKVARLYAEDKISDEEFESLLPETETFAFVPVKE